MATKKRNEIRMVDVSDKTFEIINTFAEKEKRSPQAQAQWMIEQYIELKKLKPCK